MAGIFNLGGISNFSWPIITGKGVAIIIPIMELGAFAALQSTAGFFATAGAAGADFTMNNRNKKDVVLGGLFGITAAALVAGFFALLTIAGAIGKDPHIAANAGMGTPNLDVFSVFIHSVGAVGGVRGLWWGVPRKCPIGGVALTAWEQSMCCGAAVTLTQKCLSLLEERLN